MLFCQNCFTSFLNSPLLLLYIFLIVSCITCIFLIYLSLHLFTSQRTTPVKQKKLNNKKIYLKVLPLYSTFVFIISIKYIWWESWKVLVSTFHLPVNFTENHLHLMPPFLISYIFWFLDLLRLVVALVHTFLYQANLLLSIYASSRSSLYSTFLKNISCLSKNLLRTSLYTVSFVFYLQNFF